MSKDIQIESNYQIHLKELYWELIFPAHKWSVLNIMWKKVNCLLFVVSNLFILGYYIVIINKFTILIKAKSG